MSVTSGTNLAKDCGSVDRRVLQCRAWPCPENQHKEARVRCISVQNQSAYIRIRVHIGIV